MKRSLRFYALVLAASLASLGSARAAGGSWAPLGEGTGDGWVTRLIVWNGQLIAAGPFTGVGGQPAYGIAAWDGTQWMALGEGINAGSITVHDGKLAAGGTRPDSTDSEVALWDGLTWERVGIVTEPSNGSGNNLASYGGSIYRGQYYGYSAGAYWCSLRKLLSNGDWEVVTWWSSGSDQIGVDLVTVLNGKLFVHIGYEEEVWAYDGSTWTYYGQTGLCSGRDLVMVGGELYAGGRELGGNSLVSRWDGTSPWTQVRYDPCFPIRCTTFMQYGDIGEYQSKLVLGAWLDFGNGVSSWDGLSWTRFPGSTDGVGIRALAEYDGKLVVAGSFTQIDGVPMSDIAMYSTGPTPVAITAFGARAVARGVSLDWQVSADEAFEGFQIVRSTNRGMDVQVTDAPLAPTARSYRDTDVTPGATYSYVLVAVGAASGDVTSQRVEVPVPAIVAQLHQNIPNPFNPGTTIRFTVADPQHVTLNIYDAAGRRVRTLVDAPYSPGDWTVSWDGTDERGTRVASGVYYYRMQSGTTDLSRKMVLLK